MVIRLFVVFLQLTAFRWHGESYVTPSLPQRGAEISGQIKGHSGTTTDSSPKSLKDILVMVV